MDYEKTLEELKHMKVETGSFVCLGCGHEHNCSIHGCAILRDAVVCIEELKRVLQESEAARAELGRRLAVVQQELAEVKAERDEYYEHLRGLCFCCGHQNDGFDCHTKCYGHRRGSAWVYKGQNCGARMDIEGSGGAVFK